MSEARYGEAALIWCPFGSQADAQEVIAKLLDERLIACGNIMPGVHSLFAWHGERGESEECGALLKTAADRLDAAMSRLEILHPYDQPAISGWTVRASEGTTAWLVSETREGSQ